MIVAITKVVIIRGPNNSRRSATGSTGRWGSSSSWAAAARTSPLGEALDHVAGYTVGNDVSARAMDYGYERDTGDATVGFFDWLNGKWLDGFAALGPWLVTGDEVPDPQRLDISPEVNGEVCRTAPPVT